MKYPHRRVAMIELVIPSARFLNVRNHCKVSGGLFLLMILAFCLEENIKMIKQTVIMAKKKFDCV